MRGEEFEETVLPHLRGLLSTSLRVMRDRGEAEDVVQETFLRAWKSIDRFTPGTNIRAWLYTILFRVISNHRRKWLKFDCGWSAADEAGWEATLVYEAPVAQHLSDEDVIAALDRLPVQYKTVLLLAVVEEFSYKEIAAMLRIPIGTVMSRLHRGRKMLAREMKGISVYSA